MNKATLVLILLLPVPMILQSQTKFVDRKSETAQEIRESDGTITIQLHFNLEYNQAGWYLLSFPNQVADEVVRGFAPGNVLIERKSLPGREHSYSLRFDLDGDGKVEGPEYIIDQDSTIRVEIRRTWPSGRSAYLPYLITYKRSKGRDSVYHDTFYWASHYRAEGIFKYGGCERFIALVDLNTDGVFDAKDFASGTSVFLDVDGDGKSGGGKGVLRGDQIIEYCGERFVITEVSPDGSFMKLRTTDLPIPQIGKAIPAIRLRTTDGNVLTSDSLRGTNYLLDFWGSWCVPCMAEFAILQKLEKELDGEIQIISINVDDSSTIGRARDAIKKYHLSWPQVMNALGTSDPVWKMFGSMNGKKNFRSMNGKTREVMDGIKMFTPLYVLVDREGKIQYAGDVGSDLEEFSTEMRRMFDTLKATNPRAK